MQDCRLIEEIASWVYARLNCIKHDNDEWRRIHEERLRHLARNHLPHGSGFDSGVCIDLDNSTKEKIVLDFSFHHMNHDGYYIGWLDYSVTVVPSFIGGYDFQIECMSEDDDIMCVDPPDPEGDIEYFEDVFSVALGETITDKDRDNYPDMKKEAC